MSYTQEFNFESDLLRNLLWQDDYPENIKGLITKKETFYNIDFTLFLEGWFARVFNLKTANNFGAVVWGIILGIPITISGAGTSSVSWGFENHGVFDRSNFYVSVGGVSLTLQEAIMMLRMQYYKQTVSPTIGNINYMLEDVFGHLGIAYITEDVIPMAQTYNLQFTLRPEFLSALELYDVFPRGSGVKNTIVRIP